MKRIPALAALLGGLLLSFPPLHAAPRVEELNRIVAVVDEEAITSLELEKRLQAILAQLRQNGTPAPPREILQRQVLERLIIERLQLTLAADRGVRVDDEALNQVITRIAAQNKLTLPQFRETLERDGVAYADFREEIRGEIIMNNLRAREVESRVEVTQQEVDEFLARQAGNGNLDTEYHLGHILIAVPEGAGPEQVQAARARAQQVLDELRGGADFRQLAIAHSSGQQALQGGDLGWRKGGQLPTLFADNVLRLAPGEVSEPLRSSSGFHIIKLLDKRGEQRQFVTQTHARHILVRSNELVPDVEARNKLSRLRERILQGEDFAALARANSEDPGSGTRGGDLGWANPGTFVGPFEQAMNGLKAGEISEPFRSQFGWHIVQVVERRQHDSTEELKRSRAFEAIRQRKIEEDTQDWLRRLRDEAYVEYKD
ncbi:MAG: molecular chaperone SurA [Gammaproteobacteria bacterium HGW-Gammaproteobacteria-1]|jgi:peptidyl-prolyl cis-trans isomerase SurA|nr:MAG: molecular chaperone SurA [Gammaproteobacteria bacterium HGW-Gammaproteobacteria-1]